MVVNLGSVEPIGQQPSIPTVGDGSCGLLLLLIDYLWSWTIRDGTPAVFIDTVYIKNASITSAKIGELSCR